MDLQNMDLQGGSLQISTEVIAKIARCAALEVEGVAEVSCGTQNKKLKDLLEASIQPPVAVEMRDGTAELTLHLIMASGARIPAVAEKVQENVKSYKRMDRTRSLCRGFPAGRAPIMKGILWKTFCPVEKLARMHFCWHFRRPLATSLWQRL